MTKDVKVAPAAKPKKRKIASLDRRKARAGWFFILPFLIGFVVIYLPMIWESIVMSFSELTYVTEGGDGYSLTWVGFKNYYNALFEDTKFVQTLLSGLKALAFEVPAILIFSLFMAVMLNQKMAGRAVFRAILFVPVVLSTGIMEVIDNADINSEWTGGEDSIDTGSGEGAADQLISAMDMEMLLLSINIPTELVKFFTDAVNSIYDIVNRAGVQILIFLAALQSISPAIYESCRIDGATSWETFWKITFPMVSPMILVNGVYTIIDMFTTQSNVVMSYISELYAVPADKVLSSAMAWIYFLVIILIVAVIASILSAFVFYQRKND